MLLASRKLQRVTSKVLALALSLNSIIALTATIRKLHRHYPRTVMMLTSGLYGFPSSVDRSEKKVGPPARTGEPYLPMRSTARSTYS
jgi:hypothetical protein